MDRALFERQVTTFYEHLAGNILLLNSEAQQNFVVDIYVSNITSINAKCGEKEMNHLALKAAKAIACSY